MVVKKTQIVEELRRRVKAMSSVIGFTEYTFPEYRINWHHLAIASALDNVLAGKIKRLMVFTPPRHGKTELISKRFPAYILGKLPDKNIIATSYSDGLARVANRDIQRIIVGDRYPLIFPNTRIGGTTTQDGVRNSDEFEVVGRRGLYKSSGIMGGITGRGFDIGLIDDPIKDRLEADSVTYRERLWEWYNAVFYTRRASDDSAIILVQTRWHHDDLAGRLLDADKDRHEWTVLQFEAVKDSESPAVGSYSDYDKRKSGDALWPSLFNAQAMAGIKKQLGEFNFAALYQQRPVPRTGNMFKTAHIRLVDNVPVNMINRSIRYWDKAGSVGSGCLTAGVLIHEMKDHTYLVADCVAGQWGALERETRIAQTARLDGRSVRIWCEQEPGSGGKESAEATVRNLRGFTVNADRVTGDKVSRAEPFASQVEAGNVAILNRPWTKDYLEELELFPSGKFRDKTDASTGAFNKLVYKRIAPHAGSTPSTEEHAESIFKDLLDRAKTPEEREEMLKLLRSSGVVV